MREQGNDFERKAHASEAVEAGRAPSRLHRRLVWSLGALCLLLWAGVLVLVAMDGVRSALLLPAGMAVVNTGLFWTFLARMRETDRARAEGRPVRHRRG
jgi:hypothetical protein